MICSKDLAHFLIFGLLILSFFSCSDGDPFNDPVIDQELGDIEGLHAVEFPTPSNGTWTYLNPENNRKFTLRIEDTRFVDGFVYRKLNSSEMRLFKIPLDPLEDKISDMQGREIDDLEGVIQTLYNVQEQIAEGERKGVSDEELESLKSEQKTLRTIIDKEFQKNEFGLLTSRTTMEFTVQKKDDEWRIFENFQQPFIIRKEDDQLIVSTRETFDHLATNGLVFRWKGKYFPASIPIKSRYFFKSIRDYQEAALDVYLTLLGEVPILHQSYFIPQKMWDFPLTVGKEWVVFEKVSVPTIKVIRRVVAEDVTVDVSAGSFQTFLVEEVVVGVEGVGQPDGTEENGEEGKNEVKTDPSKPYIPPAHYWVAKNVGVVKYDYPKYIPVGSKPKIHTFELTDYNLPGY
ncbi:TPA: hypothetical protein EYM82_01010 [Candidatus Poribacteria bacterium]|nr:hypothetical protein [Candidatus Poribacteria bacterium]